MKHIEEIQRYWDLRSKGFSSATLEELETEAGEYWEGLMKELLPEYPCKILDCGAGAGFFTILLAGLGHQMTAIDYSIQMLEQTKQNIKDRGLKAQIQQMDVQNLKFSEQCFDAVVSRNLFWNLEEPEKAYQEMSRVLKPGGIFILGDGNYYLHFHDHEYAARKKEQILNREKKEQGCHERHNIEGIDFSIMEMIAMDLPLSRQRRPQWDVQQLISLEYDDIRIQTSFNPLPENFLIIARKRR